MSDDEITQNLEEIRLEKALSGELLKTWDIIKRTRIFDPIDRIYGEPDAEYTNTPPGQDMAQGEGGPAGVGGGFMPDIGEAPGGDLDLEGDGDLSGAEGSMDMDAASQEEGGSMDDTQNPIGEAILAKMKNKLLKETKRVKQKELMNSSKPSFFDLYKKRMIMQTNEEKSKTKNVSLLDKNFIINEEINGMLNNLDNSLLYDDFDDIIKEKPTKLE